MVDTYYCLNIECDFGIGITEILKTGECCPKCGTQTRKLAFSDVVKLVEEKKTYKNKVASSLSNQKNIDTRPKNDIDIKPIDKEVDSKPTLPEDTTTLISKNKSDEEAQRIIYEDIKNFENYEKSIQSVFNQSNSASTEEKLVTALINGFKALIEQNKIMIKQNELILRNLKKSEETDT